MKTSGIFGLLILLLDIFAIIKIFQSKEDGLKKVLWIALILVLPVLGVIIWFLAGPGDKQLKL